MMLKHFAFALALSTGMSALSVDDCDHGKVAETESRINRLADENYAHFRESSKSVATYLMRIPVWATWGAGASVCGEYRDTCEVYKDSVRWPLYVPIALGRATVAGAIGFAVGGAVAAC